MSSELEKFTEDLVNSSSDSLKKLEKIFSLKRGDLKSALKRYKKECDAFENGWHRFQQYIWTVPLKVVVFSVIQKLSKEMDPFPVYADEVLFKRRFYQPGSGELLVESVKRFDHNEIIESIRADETIPLIARENVVLSYLGIIETLSGITLGAIQRAVDLDSELARGKSLSSIEYSHLMHFLSPRDRLIAKLLYLGRNVSIADAINLKISDVNLSEKKFTLKNGRMIADYYPSHVFKDMRTFIGDRKKGFVFEGKRSGGRINRAVIHSTMRNAAKKAGIGEDFSLQMLTGNLTSRSS